MAVYFSDKTNHSGIWTPNTIKLDSSEYRTSLTFGFQMVSLVMWYVWKLARWPTKSELLLYWMGLYHSNNEHARFSNGYSSETWTIVHYKVIPYYSSSLWSVPCIRLGSRGFEYRRHQIPYIQAMSHQFSTKKEMESGSLFETLISCGPICCIIVQLVVC